MSRHGGRELHLQRQSVRLRQQPGLPDGGNDRGHVHDQFEQPPIRPLHLWNRQLLSTRRVLYVVEWTDRVLLQRRSGMWVGGNVLSVPRRVLRPRHGREQLRCLRSRVPLGHELQQRHVRVSLR